MIFEFDEQKNQRNIELRGIDFRLVEELEWHKAILWRDERKNYGEIRECALALMDGRIYAVTFTMRSGNIRIISFRKANKRESKKYEKEKSKSRID